MTRPALFRLAAPLLLVALAACGGPADDFPDHAAFDPGAVDPVPGSPDGVTAFVGVGVLPMVGERPALENRTVLVEGGRVSRVGPADRVVVPEGARVIDGEGLWLLPGLSEMHAHVPGPQASRQQMDDILFLYLANGVTTIRSMLGAPNHLELRDAIARGERLGPTLFSASPSLSGGSAPDPETAEALVRSHASAGYDLLKLHPGLSRETYDRMVEVAREVGITWAGHVSPAVGVEHSLATGKSTIDHLDGYVEAAASRAVRERARAGEAVPLSEVVGSATPERVEDLARMTAEAGTWNAPTAYLWEIFYNDVPASEFEAQDEMRYVPAAQLGQWRGQKEQRLFVDLLENWRTDGALGADDVSQEDADALIELRRQILAALDRAGAGLLLGTDSPQVFMVPGYSLHREVRLMAEAGIPPLRILESGSRNVASYAAQELGYDEAFGTVAPGSRADLVLVEGNPLEDLERLRDPAGVMVRGLWLSRDEIRERLEGIAERMGG
jgi:imidazolonepropionase-like amidohydrolase